MSEPQGKDLTPRILVSGSFICNVSFARDPVRNRDACMFDSSFAKLSRKELPVLLAIVVAQRSRKTRTSGFIKEMW